MSMNKLRKGKKLMPYSPAERALSLLAPSNQGCGNRTSRGTAEIFRI